MWTIYFVTVQIWGKMLLFGKNQPVSVSPVSPVSPVSLGSAKLRNRWVGTQWCGPLVAGGTEPLAFVPKRLRGDPYWNRTWSMSRATASLCQGGKHELLSSSDPDQLRFYPTSILTFCLAFYLTFSMVCVRVHWYPPATTNWRRTEEEELVTTLLNSRDPHLAGGKSLKYG